MDCDGHVEEVPEIVPAEGVPVQDEVAGVQVKFKSEAGLTVPKSEQKLVERFPGVVATQFVVVFRLLKSLLELPRKPTW